MRKPRESSQCLIYHVIMRGVNRQNTFYDDTDRRYFIELMRRYCEKLGVRIVSYTLMDNHIHMMLKTEKLEYISELVKRICVSYTRHYFNKKYDRVGSLFQSRFVSRAVHDEDDVITVARYILRNPAFAGNDPLKYRFSNLQSLRAAYLTDDDLPSEDTTPVRGRLISLKAFDEFMQKYDRSELFDEDYRFNDAQVLEYLKLSCGISNISEFAKLADNPYLARRIAASLNFNRISVNRLVRITGLPRRIVKGIYSA